MNAAKKKVGEQVLKVKQVKKERVCVNSYSIISPSLAKKKNRNQILYVLEPPSY